MGDTKKVKRGPSFSKERVGKIKEIIQSHVNSYFAGTLGAVPDIVNIVAAQIYHESTFNASALGVVVSSRPKTGGGQYVSSSVIQDILNSPDSDVNSYIKKYNVEQGLQGMGLMQVMGWNIIRGASPSGKSEVQRLRPDIANNVLVEPGDDLISLFLGEENMQKQILAGLIILEGKYRATSANGEYFYVKGDPYRRPFSSRIAGAIAAYLGLGKADARGTTPEGYAESIVGGSKYKIANSEGGSIIYDVKYRAAPQVATGPSTNGINRAKSKVPGCA